MSHDKERTTRIGQTEVLGQKPPASIGPGRSQMETKLVKKLKDKKIRAEGSTFKTGEKKNVGEVSSAIGRFVNK